MPREYFARATRATLIDELIAAGVGPLTPEGQTIVEPRADGKGAWVTFDEAQRAIVEQVVAAHDAAAIDQAEEARRLEDTADSDLARQMYAILLADAARLEDTAQTLTVQVIRNHIARTDKALAAVLRQLRRKGIV